MYPTIFPFNLDNPWAYTGFQISSYGLMLVIAFLVCSHLLRKDLIKKNKNPNIADDIVFRAAIGGIIGSKLYYLIEFPESRQKFIQVFTGETTLVAGIREIGTGLVFLGGLIGGMIAVTLYIRKHNISWLEKLDFTLRKD